MSIGSDLGRPHITPPHRTADEEPDPITLVPLLVGLGMQGAGLAGLLAAGAWSPALGLGGGLLICAGSTLTAGHYVLARRRCHRRLHDHRQAHAALHDTIQRSAGRRQELLEEQQDLARRLALVEASGMLGTWRYEPAEERFACDRIADDASGLTQAATTRIGRGECILVVDDEEIVRHMASDLLQSRDYSVITAEHGREALERFRQAGGRIRLAIIDMVMPAMNGPTTRARLREIDPDLPIIMCSGYDLDGDRDAHEEGPACGYLRKPFTAISLHRAVAERIGSHEAVG